MSLKHNGGNRFLSVSSLRTGNHNHNLVLMMRSTQVAPFIFQFTCYRELSDYDSTGS